MTQNAKSTKILTVNKYEETNYSSTQNEIRTLLRRIKRFKNKQQSKNKTKIEEEKNEMSWDLLIPEICVKNY